MIKKLIKNNGSSKTAQDKIKKKSAKNAPFYKKAGFDIMPEMQKAGFAAYCL